MSDIYKLWQIGRDRNDYGIRQWFAKKHVTFASGEAKDITLWGGPNKRGMRRYVSFFEERLVKEAEEKAKRDLVTAGMALLDSEASAQGG